MFSSIKACVKSIFFRVAEKIYASSFFDAMFRSSTWLPLDTEVPGKQTSSPLEVGSADVPKETDGRYRPTVLLGMEDALQSVQDDYETDHHIDFSPAPESHPAPRCPIIVLDIDSGIEDAEQPGMRRSPAATAHQNLKMNQIEGVPGADSPVPFQSNFFPRQKPERVIVLHLKLDNLEGDTIDGGLEPGMPLRWRYVN